MSAFQITLYIFCVVIGPSSTQNSLEKEGRKAQHPYDPNEKYTEPYSGQRIRLANYGEDPGGLEAGVVEVYRAGRWGIVCDDHWDLEDATVACRQLGFIYGAEHALRGGSFSTGNWNRSSFLMDDVTCTGDETSLHQCNYNDRHNCRISEAASVICRTNIGCSDSWLAGPTGCYMVSDKPKPTIKKARKRCAKAGGHLATLESLLENDFVSNALKSMYPDRHEWLVSGQMSKGKWSWIKYQIRQHSNAHHTRRSRFGKLRKRIMRRKIRKLVETSTITSERWFPGWVPRHFGKQPSRRNLENCLIMTDRLRHPNGSDVTLSYMFWKAAECSNVNGWNYICEKPVSLGFDSDGHSLECYHGNGEDYRGNKDTTSAGFPCQDWTQSTTINPDTHPDKGLGNHSYCRNPDGDQEPWCLTNAALDDPEFAYCSVPRCTEDNSTSISQQDIDVSECPPNKFHCHLDNCGSCIKDVFRCDGEQDCPQGEDERSCDYFLPRFTKLENTRVTTHELAHFGVIPLEMCAKFCLEFRTSTCQSFSYRKSHRNCYLSGELPSTSGRDVLQEDTRYDTYELIDHLSVEKQ